MTVIVVASTVRVLAAEESVLGEFGVAEFLVGRQDGRLQELLTHDLRSEGVLHGLDGEVEELLETVAKRLVERDELVGERAHLRQSGRDSARKAQLLQKRQGGVIGQLLELAAHDFYRGAKGHRDASVAHPAGDLARSDAVKVRGEVIYQRRRVGETVHARLHARSNIVELAVSVKLERKEAPPAQGGNERVQIR